MLSVLLTAQRVSVFLTVYMEVVQACAYVCPVAPRDSCPCCDWSLGSYTEPQHVFRGDNNPWRLLFHYQNVPLNLASVSVFCKYVRAAGQGRTWLDSKSTVAPMRTCMDNRKPAAIFRKQLSLHEWLQRKWWMKQSHHNNNREKQRERWGGGHISPGRESQRKIELSG